MIGTVRTQKIFFAMGTVNTVTVFEEADEALSAAKERVKDLDLKLSAYSHDSEIYSINSCAGIAPVEVSIDTFKLIKHSVMYSKLTDGLFDITSRPLSQLWKNAIRCEQLPCERSRRQTFSLKQSALYKRALFMYNNYNINTEVYHAEDTDS